MVDDKGGSGQDGPPDPPARRPGEAAPQFGEPAGRTPEAIGPKPRASVLRQPTITVEPSSIRAAPGAASELTIGVTNNSDTVEEFTVEVDDRSVGWIRIEPPAKNLFPGTRDVFRVIVEPPRSADVRAGLKQYGLTIRSTGIPGGTASTAVQVEVLPFEAVDQRLVPRASSGFRSGRHRIEIRNQGSALWSAAVSASDPQDVLRIGVAPSIGVGPGETINVPVVVRPKPWNIIGKTESRPFTVVLDANGTRRQLDGSMDQRPFIPQPLLIPLLAAAVLIPVGLYLLGFIGGGKAESSASPGQASVAIVTPSATEPPTQPPSDQPTDTASEPASEPPSEPASETASDTPPAGVEKWAWDRRNALINDQGFDPGDPVGTTTLTSDSAAEFQLFRDATMYLKVGDTASWVIRPPVLTKFREVAGDPRTPVTGIPTGNRKNDSNIRFAQPFTIAGIACSDAGCFMLLNALYDPWFRLRDTGGYPTADVQSSRRPRRHDRRAA